MPRPSVVIFDLEKDLLSTGSVATLNAAEPTITCKEPKRLKYLLAACKLYDCQLVIFSNTPQTESLLPMVAQAAGLVRSDTAYLCAATCLNYQPVGRSSRRSAYEPLLLLPEFNQAEKPVTCHFANYVKAAKKINLSGWQSYSLLMQALRKKLGPLPTETDNVILSSLFLSVGSPPALIPFRASRFLPAPPRCAF